MATEREQGSDASAAQRKLGMGMMIAMWIIVLALLTVFFQSWQDKQHNPNQDMMLQINPEGARELVLERNRWGHYVATGAINGHQVVFMLDTGATDIAIPGDIAKQLGLTHGPALLYQTANGPVRVFSTTLDQVTLGGISLRVIRASINPNMQQQEVLLGMSFLKHLEFAQRGDRLTLRQYP